MAWHVTKQVRQVQPCGWYCHRVVLHHCLRVKIIYIWHKPRVRFFKGPEKMSYFINQQSRLSTEQIEGGSASVSHQAKQGHYSLSVTMSTSTNEYVRTCL